MFSSSVRRAAFTAPSTPTIPFISNATPRAITSHVLSYRCHQRRLSSSKPSSPADGSKGVAEGQAVPASPSQARSNGEKKASRAGRRKGKDLSASSASKDEAMHNLPSVPSTSHIAPGQIAASAFFSLHRPIALTMNFPKAVTDEAFAAIFKPQTRSSKPQEVISTLSNTLQTLDSATGSLKQLNLQDQWNDATEELRAGTEIQHLDAAPGTDIPQSTIVPKYAPFTPPPPPVPMSSEESLAASAEAAQETQQAPQQRTYRAVLTINESTHANGEVTYTAESSPLVAEDPPRTFLERMWIRQVRYEQYREQRADDLKMWAISVKRQRKLKMKKHKYKKLMRRTRNLRRRLDRN
ncbi:Duf1713 domain-containing protein [Rutstroemia sp. NJR-2017a WRK4]|nr:Duf1713 domain-containing protein [Rutstroemia sp. NJR-2017a WRK4]